LGKGGKEERKKITGHNKLVRWKRGGQVRFYHVSTEKSVTIKNLNDFECPIPKWGERNRKMPYWK